MNPIQTIRYALEQAKQNTTRGQVAWNCKEALTALAELERTHYTAEDIADASAQGFRDGVASVTAEQQPVAWVECDGELVWNNREAAIGRNLYTAAPVAQQPQAPRWWRKRADEIEVEVARGMGAMACYTQMRALVQAVDDAAQQPQAEAGNSGFDHKTAADFLSGKTVSDEAVRKFVQASRWAHDDRASLQSMLLSVRNELASREAEIALLKKELMAADATPQQAEAVPLFGEGHIEAAAKKMAEIFDYRWDFMPEKFRNTMRENVRAVLDAALAASPKGQP